MKKEFLTEKEFAQKVASYETPSHALRDGVGVTHSFVDETTEAHRVWNAFIEAHKSMEGFQE